MVGPSFDQFVLQGQLWEVPEFVGLVLFRVATDDVEGFLLPLVYSEPFETPVQPFASPGHGLGSPGHDFTADVGLCAGPVRIGVDGGQFVGVCFPLGVVVFLPIVSGV